MTLPSAALQGHQDAAERLRGLLGERTPTTERQHTALEDMEAAARELEADADRANRFRAEEEDEG